MFDKKCEECNYFKYSLNALSLFLIPYLERGMVLKYGSENGCKCSNCMEFQIVDPEKPDEIIVRAGSLEDFIKEIYNDFLIKLRSSKLNYKDIDVKIDKIERVK